MTAIEQPTTVRPARGELLLSAQAYHYGRYDQAWSMQTPRLTCTRWLSAVEVTADADPEFGLAGFKPLYDRLLGEKTQPVQKFEDVPLPLAGLAGTDTPEVPR